MEHQQTHDSSHRHEHDASHQHGHESSSGRRLGIALAITAGIFLAELAGGIISNSLALLSDAGHVLTDSFALVLSLAAISITQRPQSHRATYGYHRVGILAAAINGFSLVFIAGFIFFESYHRLMAPPVVDLSTMMPIAALGLAANVAMLLVLGHGGDLNVRSAWLHVVGDTLSSVGVIASGLVIYFTGWPYADPIAGIMIGLIIITGGARVLRESLGIMLDIAPRDIDVRELAAEILKIEHVEGVHDVHARSLSHKNVSFTAHIQVADMALSSAEEIRGRIEDLLREKGVHHITLQLESTGCGSDSLYCRRCGTRDHGYHEH